MLRFIAQRLLIAVPTIFIIIILSFFIIKAAPGGPFDEEAEMEPEVLANLEAAYHLDKPVLVQLQLYLVNLAKGDFGPSFTYRDRNVTEIIKAGLPVSVKVGLSAIVVGAVFGVCFGLLASLRKNTMTDYTVMGVAMAGIAIPTFVTAPFLALIFGLYFKLLPISGWNDGDWRHMVLPVVALSLSKIGIVSRITRGGMLDVLRANHVRTARSKGLPESRVIWRHSLRAGLVPVVTYLGPAIAGVMTGSMIIEQIFSLPGIGRSFVQGALTRDYPVVMGITIIYATLIITMNLIVDIAYRFLDPRVR